MCLSRGLRIVDGACTCQNLFGNLCITTGPAITVVRRYNSENRNQHEHLFILISRLSRATLPRLSLRTPPASGTIHSSGVSTILSTRSFNASITPIELIAEVSKKRQFIWLANASPSAVEICRDDSLFALENIQS